MRQYETSGSEPRVLSKSLTHSTAAEQSASCSIITGVLLHTYMYHFREHRSVFASRSIYEWPEEKLNLTWSGPGRGFVLESAYGMDSAIDPCLATPRLSLI